MNKKGFIILILLVVCGITLSNANAFLVEKTPIKTDILMDETAKYIITIYNTDDELHRYTYGILGDSRWVTRFIPSQLIIGPGENKNLTIELTPKKTSIISGSLRTGAYHIALYIKEDEKVTTETTLGVYIAPYYIPGIPYTPVITIDTEYEKEVDPSKPFIISMDLRNRNIINVTDLHIIIDSDLFHKDLTMDFSPLESKHIDLVFSIPANTPPGLHDFYVKALYKNSSLVDESYKIDIQPYKHYTYNSTLIKKGLFIKRIIRVVNDGNQKVDAFIPYKIMPLRELFSKHPDTVKINGERGFLITLESGEQESIVITTNYWIGIIILILIIIGIVAYYIFRSPIVGWKELEIIEKSEGLNKIKVLLTIRNRSNKKIEDIKIYDYVPSIASVEEGDYIGTTKPTKIMTHSVKGQRITWEIERLDPYEERILLYRIKTKLPVLGNIKLTPAKIKFIYKGKEREVIIKNK